MTKAELRDISQERRYIRNWMFLIDPALNILFYGFFICFSHNAFSISEDSKIKETVNSVQNKQHNHKQFQGINNRLKNQEEQIKGLKLKLNSQLENHALQIEEQKSHFQNYMSKQRIKNHTALSIILFGLLLEILGALLLGAPSFSFKIKKLVSFDMRFTPGKDLNFTDTNKNQILTNYSMLGNIFLWLGFLIQFVGTTYLLNSTLR